MLSVVGLNHPEARLLTLLAQEGVHGLDVAVELAAANGVAGPRDVRDSSRGHKHLKRSRILRRDDPAQRRVSPNGQDRAGDLPHERRPVQRFRAPRNAEYCSWPQLDRNPEVYTIGNDPGPRSSQKAENLADGASRVSVRYEEEAPP